MKRDGQPIKSTVAAKPLSRVRPTTKAASALRLIDGARLRLSVAQREALAAALTAPAPASPPRPQAKICANDDRLQLLCLPCRGGVGGPEPDRNPLFVTTIPEMGDEGRVPPPLDGVGDKLQEGWLRHVLAEGAKDRPYMLTRMPKFGAVAVADDWPNRSHAVDQRPRPKIPALADSESARQSDRPASGGRQGAGLHQVPHFWPAQRDRHSGH